MKRSLITIAVVGTLAVSVITRAQDEEESFQVAPRIQNGVSYLSGGVGMDER